ERATLHCLAKDPADRFQSAKDLASDLRGILTGSPISESAPLKRRRPSSVGLTATVSLIGVAVIAAIAFSVGRFPERAHGKKPAPVNETALSAISEKTIAVLPFESLSSDQENAYFASGVQDEILTKLARLGDLKVISRTSTAKYRSRPEDLKAVSQELGVASLLEGSVQRAAGKVRVNVQLIDGRSDTHLWANSYDRDIKDVLAVESEIAQEIASALQAKLSPSEASGLTTAPTRDPEAYDLFLRGEYEEREAENQKADAF